METHPHIPVLIEETISPLFQEARNADTSIFLTKDNALITKPLVRGNKTMSDSEDIKDIFTVMLKTFSNIQTVGKLLSKQLPKTINDVNYKEDLTLRSASFVQAVEHIDFITSFSLEWYNALLTNSFDANIKRTPQMKYVLTNSYSFGLLLELYGNTELIKEIEKIPEIVIEGKDEYLLAKELGKNDILNSGVSKGFIGSPIYNLRLHFAEWFSKRHERDKNLKIVMELKLADLQQEKSSGINDPSLTKQIAYYENKISKISFKLKNMEDSVRV